VTRRLLCEALTVGDLAVTVCEVLAANGETYELKARTVGEALRSLGLSTEKVGNEGRVQAMRFGSFHLIQIVRSEVRRSEGKSFLLAVAP
jgi:hypothetical protein